MAGAMFGKRKSCCCGTICCNRCLPLDCLTGLPNTCDNPLPMTLTCDLSATPSSGDSTCFNGSGTLTFTTPLEEGGLCCWTGTITGTCTDCNGNTFDWEVFIVVCCGAEGWTVTADPNAPCTMGIGASVVVPATCDPVMLSGCFEELIVGCVVMCLTTMPPTPGPSYVLCFDIYEVP